MTNRRLTRAIRRHDRRHLITVGMLPWAPQWGFLSEFVPEKVAPELDFISVHIYPEAGKVPEALGALKRFAARKPVVVEETFPLACSASEIEQFLLQSRGIASGWLGHYLGVTRAQLEARRRMKTLTTGQALMAAWLDLFTRLKPQMMCHPVGTADSPCWSIIAANGAWHALSPGARPDHPHCPKRGAVDRHPRCGRTALTNWPGRRVDPRQARFPD